MLWVIIDMLQPPKLQGEDLGEMGSPEKSVRDMGQDEQTVTSENAETGTAGRSKVP